MSYTVAKLITNAWYLSGIVSRDLEVVSGSQINEGLDLLNALLSIKTANNRLIPYYTQYSLTAVIGQEMYFIPNIISIETITFNLDTVVRFPMFNQSRKKYFGLPRVNNITSLPTNWHIERCLGGANLFIYFLPADTYPINIVGKFALNSVTLEQDLSLTLDAFYIEYLRYALAEYMASDYQIPLQPPIQQKLNEYESIIMDISPMDLSLTKLSTLSGDVGINWANVNFPGWSP